MDWIRTTANFDELGLDPVSREISDLLLFVRYFASQSEGIKFGIYLLYVCCVI